MSEIYGFFLICPLLFVASRGDCKLSYVVYDLRQFEVIVYYYSTRVPGSSVVSCVI